LSISVWVAGCEITFHGTFVNSCAPGNSRNQALFSPLGKLGCQLPPNPAVPSNSEVAFFACAAAILKSRAQPAAALAPPLL
jgi:hypothetical protein